jgi:DNA-binding transcriptional LysR family regulator
MVLARTHCRAISMRRCFGRTDCDDESWPASRHFLAAPFVIERTPLLATIEERLARRHLGHLGLRLFALPFDVAGFDGSQVWHRSRTADPAHLWLRERIKELALEVASFEFPLRKEDR